MLITISPAGLIMSIGMAMKMKKMGYMKGTPDIMIFRPTDVYHGLFLEFKKPGGVISEEQKDFLAELKRLRYKTKVVYSTDEAINTLEMYLITK
ncbi:MAG: VRR-NUC domain-containing protein [Candidatus Gracilibacteria bacterium]|nr:VRR-NUC domain-containing protein [Candidatus Gracilibacteria bacterium]